jgi:myo-inositol-1(or 4)-monophosphatase
MDYTFLCKETIDICKSTGAFIRQQLNQVKDSDIEQKGRHDFVSYVDKTAEEMLVKALHQLLPEAGFIAEEGTSTVVGERYNWVIDPLDGTTNFLHGLPCFSISVALIDQDEPVVGVVYEINLDECFSATKGGGAFLNGNPIRVSGQKDLEKALIATGFPYSDYSLLPKYMLIFEHLIRTATGVRRLGSAAADLAYVACGRFEFFFEYSLKHWDVAAGILLVTEAGGKISDFSGGKGYLFGKEILASNAAIFDEAAQIMNQYFND